MMNKTTNINIRIDEDLKKDCTEMFEELGMSLSSAINIFLRQSLREGGLPFDVRMDRPNRKTRKAMEEALKIAKDPDTKGFSEVDEAFLELNR